MLRKCNKEILAAILGRKTEPIDTSTKWVWHELIGPLQCKITDSWISDEYTIEIKTDKESLRLVVMKSQVFDTKRACVEAAAKLNNRFGEAARQMLKNT